VTTTAPTPTPAPPNSSVITRILLFAAFISGVVAGLNLAFHGGSTITTDAGYLAIVLTSAGTGYHVFFD
jgi:hypothetical protein